MPEHIAFEYFFGDEAEQFSYFRIPRQLIRSPQFKALSTDAKLLYGMFLDRMGLSIKNGWFDDLGRAYIYYTVDEIREDMNCGNDKALKLLAELDTKKGVGLIERIKQGQGRPTKIYVKRFTTGAVPPRPSKPSPPAPPTFPGPSGADLGFSDFQTSAFPTSRPRHSRGADLGKTDANYIDLIQTEISYLDPSIYPPAPSSANGMDRYDPTEEIKRQIDFDILREKYPHEDIESLVALMADLLTSTAPTLRIGGNDLLAERVKARFRQLDSSHIEYVLEALRNTTTQIRNIRAYLLAALYNAPVTIKASLTTSKRWVFALSLPVEFM